MHIDSIGKSLYARKSQPNLAASWPNFLETSRFAQKFEKFLQNLPCSNCTFIQYDFMYKNCTRNPGGGVLKRDCFYWVHGKI